MSTPIRILSALNMELTRAMPQMTSDSLNVKRQYIKDLLTTMEAHQSVEKGILANLGLNQVGQMTQIKKLATETTIPALKWLKPEIEKVDAIVQRLKAEFLTVDSTIKDPAERISTFIYLWQKLDVLDPNARIKRFALAAEHDEAKTLSAMLSHPEGEMIPPDMKERVLFERAQRLRPQDFENYEQAELLSEFLTMIRDWIARWLVEEVRVDPAIVNINLGANIAEVRELTGAGA